MNPMSCRAVLHPQAADASTWRASRWCRRGDVPGLRDGDRRTGTEPKDGAQAAVAAVASPPWDRRGAERDEKGREADDGAGVRLGDGPPVGLSTKFSQAGGRCRLGSERRVGIMPSEPATMPDSSAKERDWCIGGALGNDSHPGLVGGPGRWSMKRCAAGKRGREHYME